MAFCEHLFPWTGRMLIDGRMVESESGAWMDSVNPATEAIIGRVPRGTAKDVELAVAAAEAAQPAWADLSIAERAAYLNTLADALQARAEDLLAIEVADTGNSISGMRGDISSCIERMRYFAGLGYELQGSTVPGTRDKLNITLREPFGVVGRIVAFNHPIAMAVNGVSSPLMAGNTVVLKPSDQCPLSATLLAEIAAEVLPPGVVNVVTGDSVVGGAIVRHPRVKRLSFVGSVHTGMAIQRAAAEVAVKAFSLELGGKNPFVAFADAPVEKVADAALQAMNFAWQGQSCNSTSRLFLHESIHDKVVAAMVEKVHKIRIGDPFDPSTEMGAVNNRAHLERIESYVDIGRKEGARLVAGGRRVQGPGFEKGFWFEPTIFVDVTQDMRLATEEIFGPILSVMRWSDVHEVVRLANAVDVGLTAVVWTNDIGAALTMAKRLQCGYIWINGTNTQGKALPFGGFKNSGVGRERGLEELYSYTEEKSIQISL